MTQSSSQQITGEKENLSHQQPQEQNTQQLIHKTASCKHIAIDILNTLQSEPDILKKLFAIRIPPLMDRTREIISEDQNTAHINITHLNHLASDLELKLTEILNKNPNKKELILSANDIIESIKHIIDEYTNYINSIDTLLYKIKICNKKLSPMGQKYMARIVHLLGNLRSRNTSKNIKQLFETKESIIKELGIAIENIQENAGASEKKIHKKRQIYLAIKIINELEIRLQQNRFPLVAMWHGSGPPLQRLIAGLTTFSMIFIGIPLTCYLFLYACGISKKLERIKQLNSLQEQVEYKDIKLADIEGTLSRAKLKLGQYSKEPQNSETNDLEEQATTDATNTTENDSQQEKKLTELDLQTRQTALLGRLDDKKNLLNEHEKISKYISKLNETITPGTIKASTPKDRQQEISNLKNKLSDIEIESNSESPQDSNSKAKETLDELKESLEIIEIGNDNSQSTIKKHSETLNIYSEILSIIDNWSWEGYQSKKIQTLEEEKNQLINLITIVENDISTSILSNNNALGSGHQSQNTERVDISSKLPLSNSSTQINESSPSPNDLIDIRLVLIVISAGALGSSVSIIARSDEVISDITKRRLDPFFVGFLKPFVGMLFALFLVSLLECQFININIGELDKKTYFYIAAAFIAGYSEKTVQDLIINTGARLGPQNNFQRTTDSTERLIQEPKAEAKSEDLGSLP